jgi:D-alanyl-D-alanine carboxypeptidase
MRSVFIIVLLALIMVFPSCEANARKRHYADVTNFTQSARYSSLVVDSQSGDVVYQNGANKKLFPASLTKMMTLYLVFEALEEGRLSYHQNIPVSLKASMQPKTKLYLKQGETITVRDAVLGLIIKSANDAAVVLAEAVDGTEDKFARRMTMTAKQLGMKNTTFKNASGLPDSEQITTAYDMARLAIALRRDHHKYYPLFSKTSYKYKGSIITTHNRVLARYKWADGIKTGYTNASGFNLVTSTSHPNAKLVGVVMGGPTAGVRDNHMIQLLDYSYQKLASAAQNKPNNRPILASASSSDAALKLKMEPKTSHNVVVPTGGVFEIVDVQSPKYVSTKAEVKSPFDYSDESFEFAGFDNQKNLPLSESIAYSDVLTNKLHKKQETKILNKKVAHPTKEEIRSSKVNKKKAIRPMQPKKSKAKKKKK